MKNNVFKLFKRLDKKKKKVLIKTFIFSLLLLGFNTYAWFIFLDRFDGNIKANVIGWDVSFYDEDTLMDKFSLNVDSLYPGMTNFTKEVLVNNSSDVQATFAYEIVSFTLFGEVYVVDQTKTSEQLISDLESSFPFKIVFYKSKGELNSGGDNATFGIRIEWPFESASEYQKLNDYFEYDSSFNYYTYSNGTYTIDNTVSISNISSKIGSGLYIESDDADSFWGEKASNYLKINPTGKCLTLDMNLIVTQVNK